MPEFVDNKEIKDRALFNDVYKDLFRNVLVKYDGKFDKRLS
jgi:hypothetical protein